MLETVAARYSSQIVSISDQEATHWKSLHPTAARKVVVVNHGAVWEKRDPVASRLWLQSLIHDPQRGPIVLFLGTLSGKQNMHAANWIVDELGPSLPPEYTVVLCGPGTELITNVSQRASARIVGLGFIDDVDSVVAGSDLCIAPLASGAGVKTKVLHYLSHGKRVLGTEIAFEGIAGAPGTAVSDLSEFASSVIQVFESPESPDEASERVKLQEDWLRQHDSREVLEEQWRKVFNLVANGSRIERFR